LVILCGLSLRFRKGRWIKLGLPQYFQRRFSQLEPAHPSPSRRLFTGRTFVSRQTESKPAHRSVIAEIDFKPEFYAIEPPGLPFNFRLQESLCVNPHMDMSPFFKVSFTL